MHFISRKYSNSLWEVQTIPAMIHSINQYGFYQHRIKISLLISEYAIIFWELRLDMDKRQTSFVKTVYIFVCFFSLLSVAEV